MKQEGIFISLLTSNLQKTLSLSRNNLIRLIGVNSLNIHVIFCGALDYVLQAAPYFSQGWY